MDTRKVGKTAIDTFSRQIEFELEVLPPGLPAPENERPPAA
jgi:hypothetical protein